MTNAQLLYPWFVGFIMCMVTTIGIVIALMPTIGQILTRISKLEQKLEKN